MESAQDIPVCDCGDVIGHCGECDCCLLDIQDEQEEKMKIADALPIRADEWGEVINDPETYDVIVAQLREGHSVLIGWTDQDGTHLDILFVNGARVAGHSQRGLRGDDLFVAIPGFGAFGFDLSDRGTDAGYYEEKLAPEGHLGSTAEKLAELINAIRKRLAKSDA